MKAVQTIVGVVDQVGVARVFVDGTFFDHVEWTGADGSRQEARQLFVTNKLLPLFKPGSRGVFYVWQRHLFALRVGGQSEQDIEGVRRSFLYRDTKLLLLMAVSLILLPYVLLVVGKKLWGLQSARQMYKAIETSAN